MFITSQALEENGHEYLEYEEPICEGAANGSVDHVKSILDADPDAINVISYVHERTPLQIAIIHDNIKVVKYLLSSEDINLSHKDVHGRNALHMAINQGQYLTVERLIALGIDITDKDNDDRSPIILAALYGKHKIIALLLRHSADVNEITINGRNMLHHAGIGGSVSVTKMLIKRGLSPNHQDIMGMTPAHLAAAYGNSDIVATLINHMVAPIQDNQGRRALHVAASHGYDLCTRILLDKFGDVDSCDHHKKTALHHACMMGHVHVAKMLLKRGAKISAIDVNANTCLHLSICNGNDEMLRFLLGYGMNINAINGRKETPLMIAARLGQHDMVKTLIKQGADVNMRRYDGMTAIMLATQNDHPNIVNTLLQSNPNIATLDKDGRSILHHAIMHLNNDELVIRFIRNTNHINTMDHHGNSSLYHAILKSRKQIIKTLLKNGAHIESMSMHTAAMQHDVSILILLSKHGAPINYVDTHGQTPIFMAVSNKHRANLLFFVNKGANLHVKDKTGMPLVHLAVLSNAPNILRDLLDADPSVLHDKDARGKTPFKLADDLDNKDMVDILLEFMP